MIRNELEKRKPNLLADARPRKKICLHPPPGLNMGKILRNRIHTDRSKTLKTALIPSQNRRKDTGGQTENDEFCFSLNRAGDQVYGFTGQKTDECSMAAAQDDVTPEKSVDAVGCVSDATETPILGQWSTAGSRSNPRQYSQIQAAQTIAFVTHRPTFRAFYSEAFDLQRLSSIVKESLQDADQDRERRSLMDDLNRLTNDSELFPVDLEALRSFTEDFLRSEYRDSESRTNLYEKLANPILEQYHRLSHPAVGEKDGGDSERLALVKKFCTAIKNLAQVEMIYPKVGNTQRQNWESTQELQCVCGKSTKMRQDTGLRICLGCGLESTMQHNESSAYNCESTENEASLALPIDMASPSEVMGTSANAKLSPSGNVESRHDSSSRPEDKENENNVQKTISNFRPSSDPSQHSVICSTESFTRAFLILQGILPPTGISAENLQVAINACEDHFSQQEAGTVPNLHQVHTCLILSNMEDLANMDGAVEYIGATLFPELAQMFSALERSLKSEFEMMKAAFNSKCSKQDTSHTFSQSEDETPITSPFLILSLLIMRNRGHLSPTCLKYINPSHEEKRLFNLLFFRIGWPQPFASN